jgi:hypothetical protein
MAYAHRLRTALAAALLIFPMGAFALDGFPTPPDGRLQPVTARALLKLKKGQQLLLQTSSRTRRIASSDPAVCAALSYDGSALSLLGLKNGRCDLTVWQGHPATPPVIYVVEVN